jgi:hypothetical protein
MQKILATIFSLSAAFRFLDRASGLDVRCDYLSTQNEVADVFTSPNEVERNAKLAKTSRRANEIRELMNYSKLNSLFSSFFRCSSV